MTHRSYCDYTRAEDLAIVTRVGAEPVEVVARDLGRRPSAIVLRLRQAHGRTLTEAAAKAAGMNTGDVAEALGVNRSTVKDWIARKWLKARASHAGKRKVWTIDLADFMAFLEQWGGVLRLDPSPEWAATVRDLRAEAEARYLTAQQIADLSGYTIKNLPHKRGFPKPALMPGETNGGHRYLRAEVEAWLASYEPYAVLRGQKRGGWAMSTKPRKRVKR